MTALTRQNTLFVSEDWVRIYEALENVDFRAYDFENLVQALMNYVRNNFPEEFNDFIASSEFATKVEILAWLSQNVAFRIDLNTRENFLATAERRDSLIRLAQNIAYKVNRVRSAQGLVRIQSITTSQPIRDSNNVNLQDRTIRWNDPRDEDWFERFILILNQSLSTRTQFGRPLVRVQDQDVRTEQYVFNSVAPNSGAYPATANVNGVNLQFDLFNANLNSQTGQIDEISPTGLNPYNVLYRLDGRGFGSPGSGLFFPIKQGTLSFQDEEFTDPRILRTVDITTQNINRDDFFVQKIDENGEVLETWEQVDTIFGESVSFNTLRANLRNVYELDTLTNDRVRVRFGDGSFGRIPVGRFRFWYRTANPQPLVVKSNDIQNDTLVIPYVRDNELHTLTLTYSLTQDITNAAASESNFDIRSRANKAFFTQNRMITGQDYNNFYLRDNSVRKVKTVNRTFSGHSRFSRLNDPTGLYQDVKHIAEDGRLYQEPTRTINLFSADPDVLSLDELIRENINPLLGKPDKELLYYNRYPEVFLETPTSWDETSVVSGQSRGNLIRSASPQKVGNLGSENLKFVKTDSLLRYNDIDGPFIRVDRVVEDGSAPDGIILSTNDIPDGAPVVSVFPLFRGRLNNQEQIELERRLEQRLAFGISWDQRNESWQFIGFDSVDKTGEFDLSQQGDQTGTNADASWMILVEFVPGGDTDRWRVTDRGLGMFFESSGEIDFVFSNSEPVVDPNTGRVMRDQIKILGSNESRDSLRRRGLIDISGSGCSISATTFLGDGSTRCFQTSESPLGAGTTIILVNGVLQGNPIDYTIDRNVRGDSVCFNNPPPDGALIEIRLSNDTFNADIGLIGFTGDGTVNEYDLGQKVVISSNIFTAVDGVLQEAITDYGVGRTGANSSIVYNVNVPSGALGVAYSFGGVDSNIFTRTNFVGNGGDTEFIIPTMVDNPDRVLIGIDGIVQTPSQYTVEMRTSGSLIRFDSPPPLDTKVRIISPTTPQSVSTRRYQYETDGSQNSFVLTGLQNVEFKNVLVFLDGVLQTGPWDSLNQVWRVTGENQVFFPTSPPAGLSVDIYVLIAAVGNLSTAELDNNDEISGNLGNLDVSSCVVNFLGEDVNLTPSGVIRHDDGYVNPNGLSVVPSDDDLSGFFDRPLLFRNLVLLDGFTDLVLWRRMTEFGFDIWDPINTLTSPRGTYGLSSQGDPGLGDEFDPTVVAHGDIHYDVFTQTWLVADGISDTWVEAPNQDDYRFQIGRDHIRFQWSHIAPESNRIDPSTTNVMNTYVLTTGYDNAYRTWLDQNGDLNDEPIPPTSEQLRLQFDDFQQFKAQSDAIIHYSARYKPLFGNQAVPELRAVFKIVQTPGSRLSESDLRLRVLNSINEYFNVDRWEFGDSFYFTELCAFIHTRLAPDLQTVVIVPRDNDQAFGRLFQVRSEPDELLISAASPDDIEVVASLTDEELRVGSLS